MLRREVRPTTRIASRPRVTKNATPIAVLLDALDTTIRSAPKRLGSARKSAAPNEVMNSGRHSAW
jgi:hypothetical protein